MTFKDEKWVSCILRVHSEVDQNFHELLKGIVDIGEEVTEKEPYHAHYQAKNSL